MATNLDNLYFTITNPIITDLTQIKSDSEYSSGNYPTIEVDNTNSGKSPVSGDFTVYQMENQLTKNTNTFLTEYSSCVSSITPNNGGFDTCPIAQTALIKAKNMQYILSQAIGQIPITLKPTKDIYDASYQYITTNYNKLLTNRNQLDQQMKDIQKSSDSVYSTYKGSHDSTVYSQILLTVLATSLIYYVFIKL